MTNISLETLMLSIKALQRDIARHEQQSVSEQSNEEDAEYHGQYAMDLARALSELGGLYQDARGRHPVGPTLDELIRGA
jgi:hypothetical protein